VVFDSTTKETVPVFYVCLQGAVRDFHSTADEDCCLLGHDAVLVGNLLPMFSRNFVTPYSGKSEKNELLGRTACIIRSERKMYGQPGEGESTPQYKKRILNEHRPSNAWFPSYRPLLVKENFSK
jgi:hypothetical protein